MNNVTAPNYFSWLVKSSHQLIPQHIWYLFLFQTFWKFIPFLGGNLGKAIHPFPLTNWSQILHESRTLRHAFKLSRVAKWEWNKFNANITFIQICFYYLLTTGGDWVKQVKNKLASIICLTCQRRREGTYHIQTMHSCGHRMPQMRLRSIAVLLRFYIFLQRSIWFC